MGFSLSATARCRLCGEHLSSPDEVCEHKGQQPVENMFRHLVEDNIVSVEACPGFHWYALKDMVGEEWIAYGWLGPKSSVKSMVGLVSWETIDDLPNMSMSLDAPNGVQEYGD